MKIPILLLPVMLALATAASAQTQSVTVTPPAFTSSLAVQATPINLIGTGVNLHKFTWNTTGTVSAGACALTAGSDNVTFGTTLITAQTVTSSGGPTAIASGVYNYLKLNCTTPIVGTGSVTITYTGYVDSPIGDSGVISTTKTFPGACTQTTLAKFDTKQVANGGGSAITATTSCVIGGVINNITNATVTIRIQDGQGTPVIWTGGNADYSIPANSSLGLAYLAGTVFTSGIRAIAGTASALNMHIDTLQ